MFYASIMDGSLLLSGAWCERQTDRQTGGRVEQAGWAEERECEALVERKERIGARRSTEQDHGPPWQSWLLSVCGLHF